MKGTEDHTLAARYGDRPLVSQSGLHCALVQALPLSWAWGSCPLPPGLLAASGNFTLYSLVRCLIILFSFLSFETAQNMKQLSLFLKGLRAGPVPEGLCVPLAIQGPGPSDSHVRFGFIQIACCWSDAKPGQAGSRGA